MIISIFKPISTKFLFTKKKIAVVSVINDLVSDIRVQKNCLALSEKGYSVIVVGRKLPHSPALPPSEIQAHRMRLLFNKGPAFYLFFNLRLFLFLLVHPANLYFANDLDTLLPNYLLAKWRKKPLIYDSHEIFCEVPELQNATFKKNIWLLLEKTIVPKLRFCITVNTSIADYFNSLYHQQFVSVRNIAPFVKPNKYKTRSELGMPTDKKIILLQGAGINIQRGAEELTDAMRFLPGVVLYIIGSGDVWPVLEQKAKQLPGKIVLLNRIPKDQLQHYTYNADIGISIDKDSNLNYRYSLPNKLFDYMQAGLPVLVSKLPEIAQIVNTYQFGEFITSFEPSELAENIQKMLNNPNLLRYRENALRASEQLSWANEKQNLLAVIESALASEKGE